MKTLVIIPARYKSSRFPGKPLVDILGKTLIQRVWEQCIKAFRSTDVYVATDDERIKNHCKENNIQYIMTSLDHQTGTDRVCEAYKKIGKKYSTILNVQGDEPLIKPQDILEVANAPNRTPITVCCGYCKIKFEEEFRNPNIIKLAMTNDKRLLYASRVGIPTNKNLEFQWGYKQVCIYAFSPLALSEFSKFDRTLLESVEDIELLRFLDHRYNIQMVEVSRSSIPVDIPEDVEKVKEALRRI